MRVTAVEQEAGSGAALALSMAWRVGTDFAPRRPNPFEIDDEALERALAGLPQVEPDPPARLDDLEAVEVPSLWLL